MLARKFWQPAASLASLALLCTWASSAMSQDLPMPRIIEIRPPAARGDVLYQVSSEPKYWIGIYCRPLDDSLRTQLKIKQGEGVVVDGVAPKSPADQAGLQRHDLLLSMNEKPLRHPNEIMKLVEEVGTQEMSCDVIRGGKKLTIEITPAVRPEPKEGEAFQLPRQNLDTLRSWIEKLEDPAHGPLHLRGFGPAVMFAPREFAKLPEDVSIQINKTGSQPAKIVVTRGEEKWELSDDPKEITKLPEDLRPAVQAMLGHTHSPFEVRIPGEHETGTDEKSAAKDNAGSQRERDLEKRMRQLEAHVDQLLKELQK